MPRPGGPVKRPILTQISSSEQPFQVHDANSLGGLFNGEKKLNTPAKSYGNQRGCSQVSQKAKGTMFTLLVYPSKNPPGVCLFAGIWEKNCKKPIWSPESDFPDKASSRIPKSLHAVCVPLCHSKNHPRGQPVGWPLLYQGRARFPEIRRLGGSVGLVQGCLREQFPFVLLSAV